MEYTINKEQLESFVATIGLHCATSADRMAEEIKQGKLPMSALSRVLHYLDISFNCSNYLEFTNH